MASAPTGLGDIRGYVFQHAWLGLAFSTLRGDIPDRFGKIRMLKIALLLLSPLLAMQAVAISHSVLLVPVMFI